MKRIIRLDSSSLELVGCLRLFQFKNRMGLQPKIRDDALEFGQACHKAIAAWLIAQARGQIVDVEACIQIALDYYDSVMCARVPPRDPKNLAIALGDYFRRYELDDFVPLTAPSGEVAVELPFSLPLLSTPHTDVLLCGVIDSLGLVQGNVLTLKDIKTSSSTNVQSHIDEQKNRMQFKIYSWAGREYGFSANYLPVVIDGIYISKKCQGATLYRSDPFFIEDHLIDGAIEYARYVARILCDLPDEMVWPFAYGNPMCHGKYRPCEFLNVCCNLPEQQDMAIKALFNVREYNPAKFGSLE